MLENISRYKIVLASKSPRRQELLKGLGLSFEIRTKDVDESFPSDLSPEMVPQYLAEKKSNAFVEELQGNELLITSDTLVILEGKILEKPQNRPHALEMLSALQGRKHTVVTGVCLRTTSNLISFSDKTDVWFGELTQEEIAYYVDNYQPFDKAGSYGAQDWIGLAAIARLEGSYFNVMGLPVHRLYQELKKIDQL